VLRTIVILAGSIVATAPVAGADCEIFEHKDFGGQSIAIDGNRSLPRLGALNDRVSSVKVGPQCLMVAFAEEDYRGTTTTFGPGNYATLPEGWDDVISSLHCNCR
jgi:Beta/Gamma crystallin